MDYDIVLATRNRAALIQLSIPLFLAQSPPPRRLIIADASDDHASIAAAVRTATAGRSSHTEIDLFAAPRGLTSQRNRGIERSAAPVIMLPDDDSLWFPGSARAVLDVYERDVDGIIGGVSLHEVRTPPPGVLSDVPAARDQRSLSERLIYRLSPVRARIENMITPNPMEHVGARLLKRHTPPSWLPELDAVPIHTQLGFRMTYRADAIRQHGFDETLRDYALYEDHDASLRVLERHLLVMAMRAPVYHHRSPGARAPGRTTGVTLLLNLCYVTCRHSSVNSPARRAVRRYALMRLLQYIPRAHATFGRERLAGLRCARRHLQSLLSAPPDEVPARYRSALEACLKENPVSQS
jgi:glycosyltransferase involved in cell wall biosynthesis